MCIQNINKFYQQYNAYLALECFAILFLGFAKINPVNNNIVPTLMRKTGSNDEPTKMQSINYDYFIFGIK